MHIQMFISHANITLQVFAGHSVSDIGAGMRHSVVITGMFVCMCNVVIALCVL